MAPISSRGTHRDADLLHTLSGCNPWEARWDWILLAIPLPMFPKPIHPTAGKAIAIPKSMVSISRSTGVSSRDALMRGLRSGHFV